MFTVDLSYLDYCLGEYLDFNSGEVHYSFKGDIRHGKTFGSSDDWLSPFLLPLSRW